MTDGQALLAGFIGLYLYECLRWVPAHAVIWTLSGAEDLMKGWRSRMPLRVFRTRGGALGILPPWQPSPVHLIAATWPCVPHEQGLAVWEGETGPVVHVPWGEVQPVTEGKVVRFSPHVQVRCVHERLAEEWAGMAARWKGEPQEAREQAFLRKAATMLDASALRGATTGLLRVTRSLRQTGAVLFGWTVVLVPLIYWRFGDTLPSLLALGGLCLLMALQACFLFRLSTREPRLRAGRWGRVLAAAFYPPAAIRAADSVCSELSPEVHPLQAAHLLGEEGETARLAALHWRLARWPRGNFPSRPWRGPEVVALEEFFHRIQLPQSALELGPAGADGSLTFCPRCHSSYSGTTLSCADCDGMPLVTKNFSKA
jgi:hypothetical protein